MPLSYFLFFSMPRRKNDQGTSQLCLNKVDPAYFGWQFGDYKIFRQMSNPDQETWESFSDFLSSKGLRMTDQRKGVIEALFRQSGHFTAEQLLRDAQDLDETVSRATLYRSLPLLVESGIIRKVDVGQDNKFYTLNGQSETFKAQVICSDCNHIHDIDAPFMEWYGKTVAEKLGLKVKDQRLQVHAECPDFRKDGKCSKSK
jgi:Fur family ferric uptake transcriptional regulator